MAGGMKAAGWFDSSRPRTSPFDKLEDKGAKMTAKQRTAFLAREAAKETKGNGLQANTPLSSRYA
jgi:DNA-binding transcriptional regulator PaaX